MELSIIICTYNRNEILKHCLNSLVTYANHVTKSEVLIIDNGSKDSAFEVYSNFSDKIENLKYVYEPEIGLSYARNTGVENASGDWLLFLDDDAKIKRETLQEIAKTIEQYDFAMFTGIWKAWYSSLPPKWFPFDAGNYVVKGEQGVREIGEDFVSGGIMVINKEVFLKEVKCFPILLGMKGKDIGYGEESYVENLLKEKGYSIGIDTNIVIDHLVNESKYNISWHLKAAYQKGYANAYISMKKSIFSKALKLAGSIFFGWIRPLGKLLLKKKYYPQNFVIDFIGGIQYNLGSLARKRQ